MSERSGGSIPYSSWAGEWDPDDPDAGFKAEVAGYSWQDPMATLRQMSQNLDVPVGALVRYVLARWAAGGSEALLELGPSTVQRMREVVEQAEGAGTDEARLGAYESLRGMVAWLGAGLDDPVAAYPRGGAEPPPPAPT